MSLPDTRAFTVPADYLNAWCAAQPERDTHDLVADLASYAGLSWSHMRYVLAGGRSLALSAVAGLVKGLALPEDQAEHFRRTAELQHAPARTSLPLRQEVWKAFARAHGLPFDGSSALLGEVQPPELAALALAPALATLEDGPPPPKTLVRCAVVPLNHASVTAALPTAAAWKGARVAPRMVALPPPTDSVSALLTWQGMLGWAREALVRLPAAQRQYNTYVASVDEQAFQAVQALIRGLQARLVALAEAAEWLPEERVVGVLVELLPLAGPVVGGEGSRVWRWQKPDFSLPPLEDGQPTPIPSTPPGEEPMPPLAGQTHFPTWLKLWRSWRAARGEEHSDGYLARRTGLSRSAIYDISSGLVHFGTHHVPLFLSALRLQDDPNAARVLEGMARIEARQHPEHQAKLVAAQRTHGLEQGVRWLPTETHFAQSRWYVFATLRLAELPSFQAVPGWVARAFAGRITWAAAEEALVVLGHLGMLRERADGVAVPVEPDILTQGPHAKLATIELHDGVLKLTQSELGFGDAAPEVHGSVLTLPEKALPRLAVILDTFRSEAHAALMDAEARRQAGALMTRVVILSWQYFQVLRFPLKKRRRS